MRRVVGRVAILIVGAILAGSTTAGVAAAPAVQTIDVSQRIGNESEEAIAINPTNPNNIVIVTNIAEGFSGLFEAVSFDGGKTWATSIIAAGQTADDPNAPLGDSCCDPSLAFDQFGNLFLSYLYNIEIPVPIALSTDGGLNFNLIAQIDKLLVQHGISPRYLIVVVDHDSGRLVWAAGGRDKKTVARFFSELGEERKAKLELVSSDMGEWITRVVAEQCPQATLCLDPFHVVALASAALDEVRRRLPDLVVMDVDLPGDDDQQHPVGERVLVDLVLERPEQKQRQDGSQYFRGQEPHRHLASHNQRQRGDQRARGDQDDHERE